MTKKQYACIKQAQAAIAEIKRLSIMAQEACENYDTAYHYCGEIESKCSEWLKDFADTDPEWGNCNG